MNYHNIKSATHPVHEEIAPIISALKHGRQNIANLRFKRLVRRLNLMRWESAVIRNLIRKKMEQTEDK